MKLLLTNDDGIRAKGLAALATAVADVGEVVVVAPDDHRSGCSHQTTTDRPLGVRQVSDAWHETDGTPADCVRLGLVRFAADAAWVLAGINDGGNLGIDTIMSGTVAAAREAALQGLPAIAFSHYRRDSDKIDWSLAARRTAEVFSLLRPRPLAPGTFWNVNFPDTLSAESAIVFCDLDSHPLPIQFDERAGRFHYRGNYHGRARRAGTDVDICFSGSIAVSVVRVHAS